MVNYNNNIRKFRREINNIKAELKFTNKSVKSNYYIYITILFIVSLLLIMIILSYFFNTNFIYEYIILGLLLIYILYYFYNLL